MYGEQARKENKHLRYDDGIMGESVVDAFESPVVSEWHSVFRAQLVIDSLVLGHFVLKCHPPRAGLGEMEGLLIYPRKASSNDLIGANALGSLKVCTLTSNA